MDEIRVVVTPPLPPTEVRVSPPLPPTNVTVEVQRIDVTVEVEPPLPPVEVNAWEIGLAGKNGKDGQDGAPGRDGVDGDDGGATAVALGDHIISDLPHTVYDDGPSLELLYQNAKV